MTQLPMLSTDGSPAKRGRCHVHFGDWREQEPDWPRPFVYVSDVPYGIDYLSGFTGRHPRATDRRALQVSCKGDVDTSERDAAMAVEGWQAAAIFGPGDILKTPPWGEARALLIMDKGNGVGMGDLAFPWRPNYETVAIYGKGWSGKRTSSVLQSRVVGFGRSSASNGRQHPHEKDLQVVTELVSKAPPSLPVVDPFLGGGTTAVVCALLGREFWGAEIDPQYEPVIRGRLAAVGVELE